MDFTGCTTNTLKAFKKGSLGTDFCSNEYFKFFGIHAYYVNNTWYQQILSENNGNFFSLDAIFIGKWSLTKAPTSFKNIRHQYNLLIFYINAEW